MKTDELIRILEADTVPDTGLAKRLSWGLPLALAISTAAFLVVMGLRSGLADPTVLRAVLFKLSVTLPLAAAGGFCAWSMSQPGRSIGTLVWLLVVPLIVLMIALVVETGQQGSEHFAARLFGQNYWRCLLAIPVFSAAPLAALLYALRAGAPVEPGRTGMIAGLVAAGLGATLYALHCPDDSALFVATWYSIATLMTAGAGFIFGRRILKW